MGKQIAIAIGVQHAGRLTELPGAVNGAKEFQTWAQQRGYETHLVTDDAGPVTVQNLKDLIKGIVDAGNAERLLIYFGGHGIEPVVGAQYWLLSGWENDSNEAVNVNLSSSNARRSGIRQIGIFADACRSTVNGASSVGGASIFPKSQATAGKLPQWDKFFGSRPDEEAQEVSTADAAKAYGIFTRCVMQALNGAAEKAKEIRPGAMPPHVVTSQALANYLEEAVPLESGRTPGAKVQSPEVISGWRTPPSDVYIGFDETTQPGSGADIELRTVRDFLPLRKAPNANALEIQLLPPNELVRTIQDVDGTWCEVENADSLPRWRGFVQHEGLDNLSTEASGAAARQNVKDARRAADAAVAKNERIFAAGEGRETFETQQGLSIIDARPVAIAMRPGEQGDLFLERGAWHIRGHGGEPQPVAIELDNGNWIGSCILPHFVGTIVVHGHVAASVNYAPSRNGPFPRESFREIAPLLNRWTALMQQGRYGDYAELDRAANGLRQYKHSNPSLGILAAYAYERAANLEQIDDIARWFVEMGQPVPFDVALLSTGTVTRTGNRLTISVSDGRNGQVAGAFPLLAQGWSFLDGDDESSTPALLALRPGLLPGLWTTFRAEEGRRLAALLSGGTL